ncbi:MAG: triose-phosphate isomerase [Armatimonadetes bacterium]|nr:triose-phosphate isomerase [Armatimonadota bacterium]
MRTKLVVGNWKMNLTTAEGVALVESFAEKVDRMWDVDVVVCPPYLAIQRVRQAIKNTHVKLGAQDCFWLDSGAFTGKVSAMQLAEVGVEYCIVGHSEARGRFGSTELSTTQVLMFADSDETVNLKIRALLFCSIMPILCVGETAAERDAGSTDSVVQEQLTVALEGVDSSELFTFVVAYEPVWAIGTGNVCEPQEAARVCGHIRSVVAGLSDVEVADSVRVLYGGSVNAENAKELFAQKEIDGALVGGASLDAKAFARIVMCA